MMRIGIVIIALSTDIIMARRVRTVVVRMKVRIATK